MLGVQLYSVRDEVEKDFIGTMKAIKAIGYDGIEMSATLPMPPLELKAILEDIGLALMGWHTPYAFLAPESIEATIAYHRLSGCKSLILPNIPEEYRTSQDAWKRAADAINIIAERLSTEGMEAGYHNHWVEFAPIDGVLPWDIVIGNTRDDVIMQLDNGNAMHGGGDPVAALKKFPGRARSVHIKPYTKKTGFSSAIDHDDQDWPEYLRLCREVGKATRFLVEFDDGINYPDQIEGIRACYEALKPYGL